MTETQIIGMLCLFTVGITAIAYEKYKFQLFGLLKKETAPVWIFFSFIAILFACFAIFGQGSGCSMINPAAC